MAAACCILRPTALARASLARRLPRQPATAHIPLYSQAQGVRSYGQRGRCRGAGGRAVQRALRVLPLRVRAGEPRGGGCRRVGCSVQGQATTAAEASGGEAGVQACAGQLASPVPPPPPTVPAHALPQVTEDDLDAFHDQYRGGAEERADLLKYYQQFKGDMGKVGAGGCSAEVRSLAFAGKRTAGSLACCGDKVRCQLQLHPRQPSRPPLLLPACRSCSAHPHVCLSFSCSPPPPSSLRYLSG